MPLSGSAVHRTILVVDMEAFSDQRRSNAHRVVIREGLYRTLETAFRVAGIAESDYYQEDRGDGVFVLLSPVVPKSVLVESLPRALIDALRQHNASHQAEERIRLRMALHAGEINFDEHGAASASINFTFRLLDAGPLKAALSASSGLLALIVSSWFFEEVVRHSTLAKTDIYRECHVIVKETRTTGWICLPDGRYLPAVTASEPMTAPAVIQRWQRKAYVNHDQLFGADQLIDLVASTLANPEIDRTISLVGDGGIGKTATAYEAVRFMTTRGYFTRVAWASAALPYADPGLEGNPGVALAYWLDILKEIGDQLGFHLGVSRALWDTEFGRSVRELGPTERLLVVVDNLETLPDATDAVRQLRDMGITKPHSMLMTTRWELRPHVPNLAEYRVRPLGRSDSVLLIRHLGLGDPDLQSAADGVLEPVLSATEGNPFLIKLAVQQYLSSHRPLNRVMQDLRRLKDEHDDAPSLARRIRTYLYTASLQELERRCGEDAADALLATFCVKGRGDGFGYEELAEVSGIIERDQFDAVLTTACQLSIVTSFGDLSGDSLGRRYTIHSLLYDFTCGAA
jgi:NB-ARC domain-containing protein